MVKRHNKTGRRQILQLEDKKIVPGPSIKSTNRIPHYNDYDTDNAKKSLIDYEISRTVLLAPEQQPSSSSAPLDSQVADFLKEIDAMTVKEQSNNESLEPESVETVNIGINKDLQTRDEAQLKSFENIETDDSQQASASLDAECMWKEISDDSTGYSYYWNMHTNEVTWDCPVEYVEYLKRLNFSAEVKIPEQQSSKSKETLRKQKKKDTQELVEGAIIPISYFGASSSSETSSDDSDVETRPLKKHKPDRTEATKQVSKKPVDKTEMKVISNKKLISEPIGPQLPPDFQFPETVPLSPQSKSSSDKCVLQSVKSESDEVLEIGPQLPDPDSVAQETSNIHSEDSNDQASCVSEEPLQNPSQSNGTSPPPEEPSWEESLLDMEKQFKSSNKENKEDFPDSTTRKDILTSKPIILNSAHTGSPSPYGYRSVVEYDSYTDEDEDPEVEAISTSRSDPKPEQVVSTEPNSDHEINSNDATEVKSEVDPSVPASPSDSHLIEPAIPQKKLLTKDLQPSSSNESSSSKSEPIDIDSLFASHVSSQKFGLGFSRKKQLQIENDNLCSSSNEHYGAFKNRSNYPSVSFVKSNHVLDLTVLNKDLVFKDSGAGEKEENAIDENGSKASEECQTIEDKTDALLVESCTATDVKTETPRADLPVSVSNENLLTTIKKDIVARRKNKSGALKRKDIQSHDTDMEFDEIDKALSEALEEKKTLECSPSRPSTSTQALQEENNYTVQSQADGTVKKIETDEQLSVTDSAIMASNIIDLSSLLGDKLSFLHSNHSTLSSVTGFLIQLQTRLMDWQGGALDSKYFLARLEEVHNYLQHYERGLVSGDWTCQWDREHKRYFYVNGRTQHSQWTYPGAQEKPPWITSSEVASSSNFQMAGAQFPLVSSSMIEQQQLPKKPLTSQYHSASPQWTDRASPPPPPPGVDSPPPPPPPHTPPPRSPPPPPPDSTELEEEATQDMDIEDSNSSDDIPFTQKLVVNPVLTFPSQYISECSSTRSPEHFSRSSINAVSSTSSGRTSMITGSHQSSLSLTEIPLSHQPSSCSSTDNLFLPNEMKTEDSIPSVSSLTAGTIDKNGMGNEDSIPSTSGVSAYGKAVPSTSSGLTTKKEKKKNTKLLAGLALKKKNIQSLVQKWQRIKEEQEKEDKIDEAKISTSM